MAKSWDEWPLPALERQLRELEKSTKRISSIRGYAEEVKEAEIAIAEIRFAISRKTPLKAL